MGRRLYQRKRIELSFAVKKEMTDQGALTTVKVTLDPNDPLDAALARSRPRGRGARRQEADARRRRWTSSRSCHASSSGSADVAAQRVLDYFNLLPATMIDPIRSTPACSSRTSGSVGLDSAYHHLYEYGTVPIFATMGRVQKAVVVGETASPAVRDVVSLKFSFDERIADGLYCARSLDLLKGWLEDPSALERPLAR